MKKTSSIFIFVAVLILITSINTRPINAQEKVSISIDPSKVEGKIDEKIYGHFLEHIYHSVNGGLWGELVWNRSFEEPINKGDWTIKDDLRTAINVSIHTRVKRVTVTSTSIAKTKS